MSVLARLAEAYLLVLLHTVVSLQGGQQHDLEEDYQVVKTRMDVCVNLQPDNPAVYKMRADLLQRFGHLANRYTHTHTHTHTRKCTHTHMRALMDFCAA